MRKNHAAKVMQQCFKAFIEQRRLEKSSKKKKDKKKGKKKK